MSPRDLTVSRLAKLAGVSVRTLHHYDELGLLKPSGRSQAGYRLYQPAQLQRLQQILFYRELEFPLDEIVKIMNAPAFDVTAALIQQRHLLEQKAVHLRALLEAVDAALKGVVMFDAFEREAEEKWGHTDAWRESKRRTAKYGKKEWAAMKAEAEALRSELVALMAAGVKPTEGKALAHAEKHRAHVSKWFYDCTYEIHRGLAELYVSDARFTANIDRDTPGLAAYQRASMLANADRHAR